MPIIRSRYPDNWDEIALRVKDATQRQQNREYYIVPASKTLVISAIEDLQG